MTQATAPIPFHIELRKLYRHAERDEHELKFGVVGVDKPAAVIVSSDRFDHPEIIERRGNGDIAIDAFLFDAFALKCYRLMAGEIIDLDGDSGRWSIPDLSTFIQKQFAEGEAERLIKRLSRQVTEGLTVANVCTVADDDAI